MKVEIIGEFRFAKVPQSSIYPKNIYLENSNGRTQKKDITYEEDTVNFADIEKRKKLLEELLEVDSRITEIEQQGSVPIREESSDPDISDILADDKRRLPDLYSKRAEILKELGMNERDMIKITEQEMDDDFRPGVRSRF